MDWFPRMRAMSLVSNEGDSEQNEIRNLQEKLESTMSLVKQLSGQLAELKEQVSVLGDMKLGRMESFMTLSKGSPRASWGQACDPRRLVTSNKETPHCSVRTTSQQAEAPTYPPPHRV